MSHHFMRMTERKALLRQVVSQIRRRQMTEFRLLEHVLRLDAHGFYHSRGALQAIFQRFRRIDCPVLVFLKVLVVGKGKRLHGHQQRHQIADHATGLAANQLGKIGVLLLRHDGRTRGERVGQLDEAELGR